VDASRLRENFAQIAMHGDEVPLFFYSDLFIRHPEVRDMFPISMQVQRDHLITALGQIIAQVDRADELTAFLQGLGRDHRKFGAIADHYDAVATSLLETVRHFSGDGWTHELASDWHEAYNVIASVMLAAARQDESNQMPAYWSGTITGCEHKAYDISVLQVRTEPHLDFLPGQSVAIETSRRPRLWRYYSIANAPRDDGTLEFHIRLISGGQVSMSLTTGSCVGDEIRVGPPVGVLTLDVDAGRDILMVAGSTGLAPMKAMLEQVASLPRPPDVHLFFGARTAEGLYDLSSLEKLAAEYDWLTFTPVATGDSRFEGEKGDIADVVTRRQNWSGHDVYLAGPTEMVQQVSEQLTATGTPSQQIHVEDFGWSEP
jgi:NAD(P)H-flavin reductase